MNLCNRLSACVYTFYTPGSTALLLQLSLCWREVTRTSAATLQFPTLLVLASLPTAAQIASPYLIAL